MKKAASACLLIFVAQISQAEWPALDWQLGLGAQYENVQEFDRAGSRLLTERGFLPDAQLCASANWDLAHLKLELSHALGSLDYDGQTQSGRAISTQTHYRNTKASLITAWDISAPWELQIGLVREWRKRQIQSLSHVAGMEERYRSNWAIAGLEWRYQDADIAFQGILGLAGTQTVSSPNLIDPVNFKSGQLRGWRGEAHIPIKKIAGMRLALKPSFELLTIERSKDAQWTLDGIPQGSLAQPKTRRWSAGANVLVAW